MINLRRRLNFPLIGKGLIMLMAITEGSVYIWLLSSQDGSKANLLSSFLLVTSLLTVAHVACSIPVKMYSHWPKLYYSIGLVSILTRIVVILLVVMLN